jgi:flagellar biosynthesis/type III secretory pathway M-ring protein FliF/YscJ
MTSPVTAHKTDGKKLQETARGSAGWIWAAFLASGAICIALFFIPAFVIRPFRHQARRALWLAMGLRQRAPLGTLMAACACVIFAFILWRNIRRWQKALLVLALVPVVFSAVMARLNYFEWMFHPIDSAQFLPQAQSKLDAKEMIMAIRFGDDARAYPISQMAYHHVLNDVVGGVPVTVTY